MKLMLLILMLCITVGTVNADKVQRTTRKIPRTAATASTTKMADSTSPTDSCIITTSSDISLSGYEKPLRSRTETVFATNHSEHHISKLHLTISYHDMQGRELHTRSISVRCDIPPGTTRLITFPSWDKQQVFYYRLSSKPVRADGTPYDIHCSCDSATIINN